MKKMLKVILVLTLALTMLSGCTNRTQWRLSIKSEGDFTVVSAPDFMSAGGSFGWQESKEDPKYFAEFIAMKDGEYTLVLKDQDDNRYTITITRKNGNVEAKTNDDISFELKKK